ncbi:NPC intracellular cholesterol transporter 2 homolog a-like [Hydractinia symbiolongicarpus]|uniref:NPC intracellular cholesterol transporter 2 homolog a-like n=1 Tax=Hydractinia symbiolongicarpus TaxID=13093 RepID=UPI002550BF28|nr:NPC intracellular cholesterol transporter 2 homolog a-like [Hydractinia symbiolongicarpus]
MKCPLEAKKEQTYSLSLPIKRNYPSMGIVVRWRFTDQDSNTVLCIKIPTKLQ